MAASDDPVRAVIDGQTTLATAEAEVAAGHVKVARLLIHQALANVHRATAALKDAQEHSPTAGQERMCARFAEVLEKQRALERGLLDLQETAARALTAAVELPGSVRISGDHLQVVQLGKGCAAG